MSIVRHLARVGLLMAGAAALLIWLASGTEVMFADGLRYVSQARAIDRGDLSQGLARSVDHPVYPLTIVAAHRLVGGDQPQDWQTAAQAASVTAGVLLVIPLYLVALTLYGPSAAWLACLLIYMVPLTGHVLADALSESTFLLFWTWGFWTTLKFLQRGAIAWLPPTVGFAALAYLTRPEGLLLPAALACTLALMVLVPALRWNWTTWCRTVGVLVVGPLVLIGPFIVAKGGIGTKPAVARLLGLAPRSPAMAVERERPLDPYQSSLATYALGARAMVRTVGGAVTVPLLLLSALGLIAGRSVAGQGRGMLFLGVILGASALALIRLHATGGYCTPRHAMILAFPLITGAAGGLLLLVDRAGQAMLKHAPSRLLAVSHPLLLGLSLLLGVLYLGRDTLTPINRGFQGYRQAGDWLKAHSSPNAKVLDLKGWAIYYAQRQGVTFTELTQGTPATDASWVVAHDSLLTGPWGYCQAVREVVQGRKPVISFPSNRQKGVAQVHIFDVSQKLARSEPGSKEPGKRR